VSDEIRVQIIVDGDGLKVRDMDPIAKQDLDSRMLRLLCGRYDIDEDGRCIIGPRTEFVAETQPFLGDRGGESCITTERNFGDVRVKVEVCTRHP
jgi:hypothetical protein